ncbi:ABC transporter ATP-binding protein [Humitalea sp. 24SJ18S-53]|uniref:ABC transporter ATP-binding protein n=1 Tax=Humitalea sp. 24SJ18S-53 TaxID=3422307 RepID=UPI003D674A9B
MTNFAIDIRKAAKWYGSVCAVQDFDLQVPEGQFVALLGSSGSGKTTTLRMLAGLETPSGGDILVKGRRVNDVPVHKRNFGMVFQNHALFPHKTAFDNIAFGLKYRSVKAEQIRERVRRALEIVRLPHCEDRLPSQMSGGQQQRIAVARAIVIEPDLLLFDEPLSSLDAGLRDEMRGEIKRIQQTLGITTVFVTHDQAEALSMADKVVVMHNGRKQQEGTPEEIYRTPGSEFVMRFFGNVNEVLGRPVGRSGALTRIEIAEGAQVLIRTDREIEAETRFLLRADELRLSATPVPGEEVSCLQVRIVGREYLGMLARYRVEIGDLVIQVIQPVEDKDFPEGQSAWLTIRPDSWRIWS